MCVVSICVCFAVCFCLILSSKDCPGLFSCHCRLDKFTRFNDGVVGYLLSWSCRSSRGEDVVS